MSSQISTGSPRTSRRSTPSANLRDDNAAYDRTPRSIIKSVDSKSTTPIASQAIHTSNSHRSDVTAQVIEDPIAEPIQGVNNILAQLRLNDVRRSSALQVKNEDNLDKVIANLQDQNKTLKRQQMELRDDLDTYGYRDQDYSSSSGFHTPAKHAFENVSLPEHIARAASNNEAEITRMKQELEAAKSVISRQELELAESRNLRHTMEQAMGPASDADYPVHSEASRIASGRAQSTFNVAARPFTSQTEAQWQTADDGKSEFASTLVNTSMGRGRNWGGNQTTLANTITSGYQAFPFQNNRELRVTNQGYTPVYGLQSQMDANVARNRNFSSGSSNISYAIDDRILNGLTTAAPYATSRRAEVQNRTNSTLSDPLSPVTPVSPYGQTLIDPLGLSSLAGAGHYVYPNRANAAQTSPIGGQFPISTGQTLVGDLEVSGHGFNGQNYVVPAEPMNYRRLLDKSVSCDWKYIVDKIVCNNDQQASIFLQQKLKVGTAEQKYEIVESIVNQAYPLMINRFGNFLVQRCFEHGTPEQVISIANAIHGNVISLSMDPFGCHVIQKAFDSVPEDHKADMVRELLRRIPDTVIHRYACHVWQKLFELRWSGEPPQIMVKVNEALLGMWHEVALGETGSLVVQNIFENCIEEEKRPAIEEVISNIDLIAHGQFGNWCIQHLCEHGSPPDKRRVVDHILKNSYNYSIDQFASKVVEKCLKIGGPDFLERYLGVITTARPDRPRIPLIDIAGDQYGNYLIQWVLVNSHQHHREQVAIHIRKHMVSLRGSKFGSRVAMLCSNPASATRPGPVSGLINPYGTPSQQRPGSRYHR